MRSIEWLSYFLPEEDPRGLKGSKFVTREGQFLCIGMGLFSFELMDVHQSVDVWCYILVNDTKSPMRLLLAIDALQTFGVQVTMEPRGKWGKVISHTVTFEDSVVGLYRKDFQHLIARGEVNHLRHSGLVIRPRTPREKVNQQVFRSIIGEVGDTRECSNVSWDPWSQPNCACRYGHDCVDYSKRR